MAVYGWIYANAKIRGDGGDYLVRWRGSGLEEYEDILTSLSRCMLSTTKRYGQAEQQECWLFGFLDKGRHRPVVAVAGEQERILGMSLAGGGFRKQYCVLAWGLEGEDIRLWKRDGRIFEPLKEILREIQRTGKTAEPEKWKAGIECSVIFDSGQPAAEDATEPESGICCNVYPHMSCNIVKSGPEDDRLWETSLCSKPQRPVMTGILGIEEAKRMLDYFPDGVVTVIGDIEPQYYSAQREKTVRGGRIEREIKPQKGNGAGHGHGIVTGKEGKTGTENGTGRVCVGPDGVVIMAEMSGTQGVAGSGGMSGTQGVTGNGGMSGTQGVTGNGGMSGTQGVTGNGGMSGTQGVAGNGGMSGSQGISGKQEKVQNKETSGDKKNAKNVKGISGKPEKKQIPDKEKEEDERKKIIECAKRCRNALDKRIVQEILDAVGQMELKEGFSQQMKFFGCMYLWRNMCLGRGNMRSKKEIAYFLEAWKEKVKNKNGAFEANKIMADEVTELMRRRR